MAEFSTKGCPQSRLQQTMSLFFVNKLVRFLLTLNVSIWLAGGCLLGCSNNATAAEAVDSSAQTVEAGESCHSAQAHDCCAAKKPKKNVIRQTRQPEGVASFTSAPRGAMGDCPLAMNATAVTSKKSAHVVEPGRGPVAVLATLKQQTQRANNGFPVSYLPNLGPTHLRCCVFLI